MNFITPTNEWILSFIIFSLIFQHSKSQSVSYVADQSTVNEYARDLANLKDISSESPYTKFRTTCHRFNACMLHRSQKLESCKILTTMERYSYVYRANYMPLVTCKKLEITIDDLDLNANSRPLKVYGFKCPIPVRVENLAHKNAIWKRNHTNVVYYISSGNLSSWAIMYYSHASDKPKIKPDIAIVEFPVTILSQLIRDERSQRYLPNPFFKQRSFFSDFLPHRTTESIDNERMTWSPLAAEERLVKFLTEIRENKELTIYDRFQTTYHHTNVCGLTGQDKAASCKHSFDTSEYTLLIGAGTTMKEGCEKKSIFYENLEIPPTTMAVLKCPLQADVSRNSYYLSSAGSKDDILTYLQVNPHQELLADAIIHEISQIVRPRRLSNVIP